jgi:hypothetical protein
MIPTVVRALIKKEFILLWRGTAQPVTTTAVDLHPELELHV